MNQKNQSPYSNHDEVWLLLPWYSNGSLEGKELELVRNHLRVCLTCRKELAAQETLSKTLQHASLVEISAKPSFERLMARIQEETRAPVKADGQAASRRFPRWPNILRQILTSRRLTLAAATGLAFATVLLAISIPLFLSWTPIETVQNYHTAANPDTLGNFAKNDVRVVFADHVTEREIADLLKSVRGQIVDGPTASRIYTIRISDSDGLETSITQFLQRLRESKTVIFAEPALPRTMGQPKEGR